MMRTGKPLSELRRALVKFPQAQRNVRVTSKPPVETLPPVRKAIEDADIVLVDAP